MSLVEAHPNARTLRAVYADLTRIADHCAADAVLHPADRDIAGSPSVQGREAIRAHERRLIALTGGTLVMDVEQVCANDHFGVVLGVLRARPGTGAVAMPFCGLWRFRDGLIVEHWENAYDPAMLDLTGSRGRATGSPRTAM